MPWAAPALLTIYIKMILSLQSGVCYLCFYLSGQSLISKAGELSYFRADLLVGFLVFPVLFLLLGRLLPRIAPYLIAAFSVGVYLYLFVQLQCLVDVGTFIAPHMLADALRWGAENPGAGRAYLSVPGTALLVGGLLYIAAAFLWSLRRGSSTGRTSHYTRLAGNAVLAGLVIGIVLSWVVPAQPAPLQRSVFSLIFHPAGSEVEPDTAELSVLTAPQLLARYRQLARSPAPRRDPAYWGKAAGFDVLFVVFETGPARCLRIEGDLSEFPTLARLRQRALICPRHYTTAPVTLLAVFSLFSSLYPPNSGYEQFRHRYHFVYPGLPRMLAAAGYRSTAVCPVKPSTTVAGYGEQLRAQGVGQLSYPADLYRRLREQSSLPDHKKHRRLDLGALKLVRAGIEASVKAGRRYLIAFFPQIGHAPWPDLTGWEHPDIVGRGRALLAIQDEWLGKIVNDLERLGRLEKTIIVVTADHGIRTRKEDPDFPVGMVDDYSYHVPLLIAVPGVLQSTVVIPYATSHIDVAPTVADLLGMENGREFEQGLPVWDTRIRNRTTFYLGKFLVGADALLRDGRFYMFQYLTGSVFASDRLHFDRDKDAVTDPGRRLGVATTLTRFEVLQRQFIDDLARLKSK